MAGGLDSTTNCAHKTGRRVAVVGWACRNGLPAQQLAERDSVRVYEKENRIGGLLRYGIPDFKLNKKIIDRRIAQMKAEGVNFTPTPISGWISRRVN